MEADRTPWSISFSIPIGRFLVSSLGFAEQVYNAGPVFSYKLRYIVGFWLVEMAISTNQKPTIYRNLYENTGLDLYQPWTWLDIFFYRWVSRNNPGWNEHKNPENYQLHQCFNITITRSIQYADGSYKT